MHEKFLGGRVLMYPGDCMAVLPTLAENSIDSCVTDPPYHLTSIVKRFGGNRAAPAQYGTDGAYARASAGFMGKQWDGGNIAFRPETWAEVYRVLKPGAHLLAFGGTRTYHRMACAIEDAGFEIRDCIMWVYGSGFPKSHDVSKGIDKAAGAERDKVGRTRIDGKPTGHDGGWKNSACDVALVSGPAITDAARQWEGWGTALKPAVEPIILARKPPSEKTVAANVLRWGTGAINVDGCRIPADGGSPSIQRRQSPASESMGWRTERPANGRWPANLIHDGGDEVVGAFPAGRSAGNYPSESIGTGNGTTYLPQKLQGTIYDDSGSAARFFYCAKADADDRIASKHPTVKPVDLMRYLCRLVTPPGGTVLDLFAGSGTTGEAAWRAGFSAVLIEREAEYQDDIGRRMKLCLAGPDERSRETMKQRMKDKAIDAGPLFCVV